MSLTGVKAIEFSARRAHREPSWTRSRSSSWGFLRKASQHFFYLHKAPQLYFDFFSDPTTQLGSSIQGSNTHSDGCLFFEHRDRDSGSSSIYYMFQHRLGRVCWFACSFICLFVCSGLFVSLFFYSTETETRVRHLSTVALASTCRHGKRGVNNTQAVMKNCPVFAGKNKESFQQ